MASPENAGSSAPGGPHERQFVRPDGSPIDVEMISAPIVFDGQPAVQVIVNDITAQKETAAQLQQAKKTAAMATLAVGMAHEFNNCLTAIMGFSDLTLPLLLPDSRAHEHVQQVVLASKRARDLVAQMLLFGRQEDNAKQPISLDILLKESLRILRGRLPDNITLREWIPGAIKPVFANPIQIHQVCVDLLAHSEQVMRMTGGVLEVRLDNIHLPASANGCDLPLPPGQYVRLTVSDTDEAMSSDVQSRSARSVHDARRRGKTGRDFKRAKYRERTWRHLPRHQYRRAGHRHRSIFTGDFLPQFSSGARAGPERSFQPSGTEGNSMPSRTRNAKFTVTVRQDPNTYALLSRIHSDLASRILALGDFCEECYAIGLSRGRRRGDTPTHS